MRENQSELERVRVLIRALPEVEEGTIHGAPSWKLNGKLLACQAIHKSVEPNTLLVKIAPAERTQLLATKPATYYVTDHYRREPVVLVRLSKIDGASLKALLKNAWQFVDESGATSGHKTRPSKANKQGNS